MTDLWRVCRVISQENRLRLLRSLFADGEQCVKDLIDHLGMTQPNASLQLKTLYSAGLVQFRREKMNVIYRAAADSRSKFAAPFLKGLEGCFKKGVPLKTVIRQATALTHERRIEIVRALKAEELSYNQLLERGCMNSSALSRHLRKLERREFVAKKNGVYHLSKPAVPFGRLLLKIACSERDE